MQDEDDLKTLAAKFFRLARASPENAFTLGLLNMKSELMSRSTTAGVTVSASVQHQVVSLFYDKYLRLKKADRLRDLLYVCRPESVQAQ